MQVPATERLKQFNIQITMTQEELSKVLEAHKRYLAQDCEGWEDMSADLSDADLSGANLIGADLSGADLRRADLSGADLSGANLRSTNLRRAYLRGAYLSDANLSGADLSGANLSGADLRRADLRRADLSGAYLSGADLSDADLRRADLRRADLREVKYNETTAFLAMACPEDGDFIAWKKVGRIIVKLRIPAEAKRSSATTRKCRCEYAEVLELQNLDGTPYKGNKVVGNNYVKTIYKVGEIVRPDSWDENRWNDCSHGIHFFITRDEAVGYQS